MHKIFCLNNISEVGTKRLGPNYELAESANGAEGILVRSASMHDMDMDESLLAVARAGAGVNNIPVEKCSEKGVVVFNTPGANANAVKELVLASLFLSSRKIVDGINWVKSLKNEGDEVPALVEKGKAGFAGPELQGKTLGVVGLGAIGILVANSARRLGMNVYGYDPFLSVRSAWGLSSDIRYARTLDDIYKNCDYITLHAPLAKDTKEMINSETLAKMKNGVKILNFSRGELVNTNDIISALSVDKVDTYVTDFPNAELIGKKGVIAIPHLGASTPESEDNCAVMAVNQMRDYIENGNINNSVNLPSVSLPRTPGCKRICILHKNVPNTISLFAATCGDTGINIENMISKARGDYAYTILEVTGQLDSFTTDAFDKLEPIVKARFI